MKLTAQRKQTKKQEITAPAQEHEREHNRQSAPAQEPKAQPNKRENKPLTLLALTLAVLLACFGLSACSSVNTTTPASQTVSESTTNETAGTESGTAATRPDTAVAETDAAAAPGTASQTAELTLKDIPACSGTQAYVAINNNVPFFTQDDYTTTAFENYSPLDSLGRCGAAYANICQEIMPTEKRGAIGQVKPSGWQTVKYDFVDGKYLYNRCHLIGYQLAAENANTKNLITGTRYFNTQGMLPFENMVADYVKETAHHVLYRVTPFFDGRNLVAAGVLMEALSVEDKGDGICFNVFCYNIQPGVTIDYATGKSSLDKTAAAANKQDATEQTAAATQSSAAAPSAAAADTKYILNTNRHKFHYPSCASVQEIKESNKQEYTGNRADLIKQGYAPCGNCKP